MLIEYQKTHEKAKLPVKAHTTDAGIDLFFCPDDSVKESDICPYHSNTVIKYSGLIRSLRLNNRYTVFLPTGIKMSIPEGYCGILKDRSSYGTRGLHVVAGVIDSDYRGEIVVVMINLGFKTEEIKYGDKIAQMLIVPVPEIELKETVKLSDTVRGEGGFGSTGV